MHRTKIHSTNHEHIYNRLEKVVKEKVRCFAVRFAFACIVPLLAVLGTLYLYDYGNEPNLIPSCFFYRLTGLYCPGCGGGRALYSIFHGQLLLAVQTNVLFVLMLPIAIYFSLQGYLSIVAGRSLLPVIPISFKQAQGCAIIIIIFTLLRNIPVYPFLVLAP